MSAAKITYFVHDLTDPAVHRRVQMLTAGGATVTPIGFRRSQETEQSEDTTAVELGSTADGRLLRRMLSVAAALTTIGRVASHVRGSDAIVARNLEMLVLAARARRLYARDAALIYESLDIHRLLLSSSLLGRILRLVESTVWRDVGLLVTSSPAFVQHYFRPRGFVGPIRIEENKVLMLEEGIAERESIRRKCGPPWRIGWFGMIRCRKSLDILSALADAAGGAVEIIIRGRPSSFVFPDFENDLKGLRNVRYLGPYDNPEDLAQIYGEVHFNWTIDFYESGLNSAWLLPCRMYEGSLFGAIPIAENGVETANWLRQHHVGVILNEPIEQQLLNFFSKLDQSSYIALADQVNALAPSEIMVDRDGCESLVQALRNRESASRGVFSNGDRRGPEAAHSS
jgi:succinoglycan biosynthesis protein ExoL